MHSAKKSRKGETLVEFLMALTVFIILMGGVFEFMADHTLLMLRMKTRDELAYYARQWLTTSNRHEQSGDIQSGDIKFKTDGDKLTVSKGKYSFVIKIK